MRIRYLAAAALVGALCAVAVTVAIGASSSNPGTLFAVGLGKKEVSPTTGEKGAGDRNGRAGFTAVIDGTEFCWGYAAKNVNGTPSGAHIHRGGPDRNGPVVIPLDAATSFDPGAASGCETITSELAGKIRRNPAKYYFNLHTTGQTYFGDMRGQLQPAAVSSR